MTSPKKEGYDVKYRKQNQWIYLLSSLILFLKQRNVDFAQKIFFCLLFDIFTNWCSKILIHFHADDEIRFDR